MTIAIIEIITQMCLTPEAIALLEQQLQMCIVL